MYPFGDSGERLLYLGREALILVLGDKGVKVDTVGYKIVLLTFYHRAVRFLCLLLGKDYFIYLLWDCYVELF